MKIGNKIFKGYTFIAAIINLTPDSFFSDSRKNEYTVLKAVEKAQSEGAAIIDLGAQSTRPGYTEISPDEELKRLIPSLEKIKKNFDIPVSVDTYFCRCAREALFCGADMINDIHGLTGEGMAETIASFGASVCIMHSSEKKVEGDIIGTVKSFLIRQTEYATGAGIDKDKICVDGGIGFGKDKAGNFLLLENYEKLDFGYPLYIGTSRKSMFGGKAEDRLQPTLESTRLAAEKRVLFVRVHDVRENTEVIKRVYDDKH